MIQEKIKDFIETYGWLLMIIFVIVVVLSYFGIIRTPISKIFERLFP